MPWSLPRPGGNRTWKATSNQRIFTGPETWVYKLIPATGPSTICFRHLQPVHYPAGHHGPAVQLRRGVYIKLPLGDLLNRRNQLKAAKAQVAEAHELAEAQKDEIRQLVIKLYQDLLLRQRLLNIAAHSWAPPGLTGIWWKKNSATGSSRL